mmetsp:Transcript_9954/g.27831  ORF Transcript_9954/g.27831 Transcript_9954/m.27831 type:complete len:111 (-) Transcript_9954:231-563(-)
MWFTPPAPCVSGRCRARRRGTPAEFAIIRSVLLAFGEVLNDDWRLSIESILYPYFFEVSLSDPILGITHRNQTQQTLATTGSDSTITSGTLHRTPTKSDDKKRQTTFPVR